MVKQVLFDAFGDLCYHRFVMHPFRKIHRYEAAPPLPPFSQPWVHAFLSISISSLCVTDTNFAYISWQEFEQISEKQKQQKSFTHVFNFKTISLVSVYYS